LSHIRSTIIGAMMTIAAESSTGVERFGLR
jgi:hypothetical protein